MRVWLQAVEGARDAHATCQPHPCGAQVGLNERGPERVLWSLSGVVFGRCACGFTVEPGSIPA